MIFLNKRNDMQSELTLYPCETRKITLNVEEGKSLISVTVPTDNAELTLNAIKDALSTVDTDLYTFSEDDENDEVINASEIFSDVTPAMLLRGLRGKEGISQIELAERLGIAQNMVSDMENGKRNISIGMAKRIGETFNISYKTFL